MGSQSSIKVTHSGLLKTLITDSIFHRMLLISRQTRHVIIVELLNRNIKRLTKINVLLISMSIYNY